MGSLILSQYNEPVVAAGAPVTTGQELVRAVHRGAMSSRALAQDQLTISEECQLSHTEAEASKLQPTF